MHSKVKLWQVFLEYFDGIDRCDPTRNEFVDVCILQSVPWTPFLHLFGRITTNVVYFDRWQSSFSDSRSSLCWRWLLFVFVVDLRFCVVFVGFLFDDSVVFWFLALCGIDDFIVLSIFSLWLSNFHTGNFTLLSLHYYYWRVFNVGQFCLNRCSWLTIVAYFRRRLNGCYGFCENEQLFFAELTKRFRFERWWSRARAHCLFFDGWAWGIICCEFVVMQFRPYSGALCFSAVNLAAIRFSWPCCGGETVWLYCFPLCRMVRGSYFLSFPSFFLSFFFSSLTLDRSYS